MKEPINGDTEEMRRAHFGHDLDVRQRTGQYPAPFVKLSDSTNYEAFDRHQPRTSAAWTAIVCFVMGFAAAVVVLLMLTADAQAQTVPSWEKLNESCQGAPLTKVGKQNPDCAARNKVAARLVDEGWMQGRHGVWVSPEQQNYAGRIIAKYDGQLAMNAGAFDSIMPAMLVDLRAKLSDAQIFAIWNERRNDIHANAPYGAVMLEELLAKLTMHYARKGDPRLALGQ